MGKLKDFRAIYRNEGAYHKNAQGFKAWFLENNYEGLSRYCPQGGDVIDLACGEGCLSPYLPGRGLVGVDNSPEALKLCQKHYPDAYRLLLEGDLSRLDALDLTPASFSAAVCSLSLMYLDDHGLSDCLRCVHRMLEPGGVFVASYPNISSRRQGSNEALELKRDELQHRFERSSYQIDRAVPICPMVSPEVVSQSQQAETVNEARRRFDTAAEKMTLDDCYHYVLVARTVGDG